MSSQIIEGSGTGSNPEAMLWSTRWCYIHDAEITYPRNDRENWYDRCWQVVLEPTASAVCSPPSDCATERVLLVPVSVVDQIRERMGELTSGYTATEGVAELTATLVNGAFAFAAQELEWVLDLLGVDDE